MNREYGYLQEDSNGLLRGTYVLRTEPTSAHLQAEALLRHSKPFSHGYYRPVGDSEVYALDPSIIDKYHPDAPELCGPFVLNDFRFDVDRLTESGAFLWTMEFNWPTATLILLLDDRTPIQSLKNAQSYTLENAIKVALESRRAFSRIDTKIHISTPLKHTFKHSLITVEDTLCE